MKRQCKVTISEDEYGSIITFVKWTGKRKPVVYSFHTSQPIGNELCPALFKVCNTYLSSEV